MSPTPNFRGVVLGQICQQGRGAIQNVWSLEESNLGDNGFFNFPKGKQTIIFIEFYKRFGEYLPKKIQEICIINLRVPYFS